MNSILCPKCSTANTTGQNYCSKCNYPLVDADSMVGINGWLSLFVVILILNLITSIFEVVSWDSIYNNWKYSSDPVELLIFYFLIKLLLCIVLTILFFKKYSGTRAIAIIFFTMIVIWPFIEFPTFDRFNSNSPIQALIAIPWIFYFAYSKRVKYTFMIKDIETIKDYVRNDTSETENDAVQSSSIEINGELLQQDIYAKLSENEKIEVKKFIDYGLKTGEKLVINKTKRNIDRFDQKEWNNIIKKGAQGEWLVISEQE